MTTTSRPMRIILGIVSIISTVLLLLVFPMFAILFSAIGRIASLLTGNHRLFELIDNNLIEYCERLIVFCCETVCPHEIVLHGHTRALDFLAERNTDRVIYISNHTAAADWIVAEFLGLRANSLSRLRFVMKNSLRFSPLYGWFLRQRNCIYVKRGGGEVESFRKQISRLGPGGVFNPGAWMIIFPEGTRIRDPTTHPKLLANNREYASSKNLKIYDYLLTPKHRGLSLCVEGLTGGSNDEKDVCWLLNATVFYEPRDSDWVWESPNGPENPIKRPRATSIIGLLTGAANRIHVHLDLISLNDKLPGDRLQSYSVNKPPLNDEPAFMRWLEKLYSEKDALLKRVYSSVQQEERVVSFGAGISQRVLPRPYADTVPHALFAFAFLYLYFTWFGFWFVLAQFILESVIGYLLLAAIPDESSYF